MQHSDHWTFSDISNGLLKSWLLYFMQCVKLLYLSRIWHYI